MLRLPFTLHRCLSLAPAILAFGVWLVVLFSAVSWGFQIWAVGGVPAVPATATALERVNPQAVVRSLGEQPAPSEPAISAERRFQLQGVLTQEGQSVALLAVDGKVPKPYRVGAEVAEGWVVQSAQGRRVTLGPSLEAPAALTLTLPSKK